MLHLLEHINQDITRRQSKGKDSTVNETEYRSKRDQTGKPGRPDKQSKLQAPTISTIAKSLSRNRHSLKSNPPVCNYRGKQSCQP